MSFDWEDYLRLSEELAKRTEESCWRSSISRSYFGVWCIARNKKGYINYKPKDKGNIHWIVIDAYKSAQNKNLRKVGWSLAELRRARNDADYNENRLIDEDFAKRMLILAKQVLTNLLII